MIGYIEGSVKYKEKDTILVLAGQVGYTVHVPQHVVFHAHENESIALFVYTSVKEDAIDLFGFSSQQELSLFKLLLSVNGVGPKSALATINLGTDVVISAIQHADTTALSKVPRLGKKTSQKIIIELQPKLGELEVLELSGANPELEQAIEALTSMGYDKRTIIDAVKTMKTQDLSLDQIITAIIKTLGARHGKA